MYKKDMWIFDGSIEVEIKHRGRYGAKGEGRLRKKMPTPEQIKRQNQLNKEKRMRRLIKANFKKSDLWVTLKYSAGERKPLGEVLKDLKRFFRRLRTAYKARGMPLKYIYRLEIGKLGGIHIHLILNRIADADLMIQRYWTEGRANYESMYERGGFEALAAYIVKPPPEEMRGQLSLFDVWERKVLVKYSASRNLKRPEPKTQFYLASTVMRIVKNGPPAKKGYYIDRDSVRITTNFYTGLPSISYTLIKYGKGGDGDG